MEQPHSPCGKLVGTEVGTRLEQRPRLEQPGHFCGGMRFGCFLKRTTRPTISLALAFSLVNRRVNPGPGGLLFLSVADQPHFSVLAPEGAHEPTEGHLDGSTLPLTRNG